MRIRSVGHAVFAITMIALGVMGLVKGGFTPVWSPVPKAISAREFHIYLTAIVSLGSGLGLLFRRTVAVASSVLFGFLVFWWIAFRLPEIFNAPATQDPWSGAGETAVMVAAAWVLFAWFDADWKKRRLRFLTGEKGLRLARVVYGLAMIPFGVAHFTYLKETVDLIPGWLPWHAFWAYFFGCTFIAAGLAILIGFYARLAAALSALQLGMFTLLVWIPIVAAGSKSAFVWSETILSWALTAAAWVVADSYGEVPWLAMNMRSFGRDAVALNPE